MVVVKGLPLAEVVEQLNEVFPSSSSKAGAPSPNALGALFAAANTVPVISKRNTAKVADTARAFETVFKADASRWWRSDIMGDFQEVENAGFRAEKRTSCT